MNNCLNEIAYKGQKNSRICLRAGYFLFMDAAGPVVVAEVLVNGSLIRFCVLPYGAVHNGDALPVPLALLEGVAEAAIAAQKLLLPLQLLGQPGQ